MLIHDNHRNARATVFSARDVELNMDVALKVLPAVLNLDPTFVARFRREAHALARLNHPHSLRFFVSGTDAPRQVHYLVLEYLTGGTLSTRLTGRPWDLAQTLGGHADAVRDVTFASDGATLASASADASVKLWLTATGAEVRALRGHERAVNRVAFTRDGTLVSGSDDGTVKFWSPQADEALRTQGPNPVGIRGLAVLGNTQLLLAGPSVSLYQRSREPHPLGCVARQRFLADP